jgi:hypothetical protein
MKTRLYKKGDVIDVYGYFTLKKYILYANANGLKKVEQTLGFHDGRLKQGAYLFELLEIPEAHQFDLAAYSQVAQHRFKEVFPDIDKTLDIDKAKQGIIEMWKKEGGASTLVKIKAVTDHVNDMSDDTQYPPGLGVPQWRLTKGIRAKVIGFSEEYPFGRLL